MRSVRTLAAIAVSILMLTACSGDDDSAGVVANPTTLEELADTDPVTESTEDPGATVTQTPDSAVSAPASSTDEVLPDAAVDPTPPDAAADPATADPAVADGTVLSEMVTGDGFTISFPVPPNVETVEVPLADGQSTQATIYQAQVDGTFLGFSFADTPDPDSDVVFDEEAALRDSAQGAADNTGGAVAEATIIDFQGRTAIDYLVTVEGGAIRGIAFFEDTRLYTGQQVTEGGAGDRELLDTMMATLVLG